MNNTATTLRTRITTKFELMSLLYASSPTPVIHGGNMYYVTSIEREDGSGKSFNVGLAYIGNAKYNTIVNIRTAD